MNARASLKLLTLCGSRNDGEAIVTTFRNAGRATRAHVALEPETLCEELSSQDWDLLVLDIRPDQLAELLPRLSPHLPHTPTLLLGDAADGELVGQCLRAGLRDVVPREDTARLILVAEREIAALQDRRQCSTLQHALDETRGRCEQVLNDTRDAVAYIADGMHVYANPVYAQQFGFETPEELDCVPVVDLIAHEDQPRLKKALTQVQLGELPRAELALHIVRTGGDTAPATLALDPSQFDGEACVQIMLLGEMAAAPAPAPTGEAPARAPEPVAAAAAAPAPQGLDYFVEALAGSLAGGSQGALMVLLPDDFIELQDKSGLFGSGQVLSGIARFAREHLGEAAEAVVVQEAVLIWQPECSPGKVTAIAEGLAAALAGHDLETDRHAIHCTASIGACAPGPDCEDLHHAIDTALRAAIKRQQQGGNGALAAALRKASASGAEVLENALEDNRFRLLFQPIISLRAAGGEFYEVVLRYIDEDGAEQAPDNFIRSHCQAGNTRLDRWMVMEATKRLAQQRKAGHQTRLILNLTANALQDDGLLEWLGVAAKAAGLPPEALVFQFAEADVAQHSRAARDFSAALGARGFKVSLSDFGCSPDPFRTLKLLSADMVKVDGSFTRALQQNSADSQALKALIAGLREEGKLAVVPFVENAAALATLWQVGPDYIQGHYLAAPLAEMNYEFTELA